MMLDDSIEVWLAIERLSGHYEVSNYGRVRRAVAGHGTRVGRLLKPRLLTNGYFAISTRWGNQSVHVLVAEAFLPPKPGPKHEVNHRDGNKLNNRLDNLEWVTRAGNIRHARGSGLMVPAHGERLWSAKLTERQVRAIRKLSREWKSWEIGEVLGVKASTVREARNGRKWRHVV
jgi:hypothetical protein